MPGPAHPNQRRHYMLSSRRISLILLCACIGAAARAHADTRTINFENPPYAVGSIGGQDGWGGQTPPGIAVNGSIDQQVSAVMAHGGSQSYRESSVFTTNSFGDQVFSPSLVDGAGEPGAITGGFTGGTLQPRFTATFWVHSATAGAQNAHVVVSPDRGDGARMSWVQVSDNATEPPSTCADSGNPCASDGDCPASVCLADGRS